MSQELSNYTTKQPTTMEYPCGDPGSCMFLNDQLSILDLRWIYSTWPRTLLVKRKRKHLVIQYVWSRGSLYLMYIDGLFLRCRHRLVCNGTFQNHTLQKNGAIFLVVRCNVLLWLWHWHWILKSCYWMVSVHVLLLRCGINVASSYYRTDIGIGSRIDTSCWKDAKDKNMHLDHS